jgi:WD40 repeat protein/serine/threonine protein kinase
MSEDQQNIEEFLFEAALEKTSAAERAAFLNGACRNNSALRARLDVLLEGHFAGTGFLKEVPARPDQTVPVPPPSEAPARMIGRYKLLEKIGEGGMGEVWMAEQREPVKRRVALKIVKLGMDSRQIVARFEAERQALAMMDHANIAKILDAGTTGEAASQPPSSSHGGWEAAAPGRPYFVMELVRGIKITDYCDQNQLPTRERLDLFIQVCKAIQHAHQKGIIHRDIKPSNILVTLHDGVPVPKVIDFGIAKATQQELTDKTVFTQFQQFIGTPAYISPEQAEMSGLDIDTRADIYSLGVLLYELLVGRTPFDAKEMMQGGLDALRQIIREREPLRPSTKLKNLSAVEVTTTAQRRQTDPSHLNHQLRGDLDWIVMKCLEKDRTRRYDTANGLAMDIQRHLANEPVVARPPSTAYKIQKLIRRNKLAFTAAALVFLALMLGVTAVILVQHRANQDYRRRLYVSEVNRAGLAWQSGQAVQMRTLLERCPADMRKWEWNFLQQQLDRWEQKVLLTSTNLGGVAFSADGDLMVVAADGVIQVRAVPSGQWLRNVPVTSRGYVPFALAPRGDLLATAEVADGTITIWNVRTGERVAGMSNATARVLAWSNNGQRLASAGDDTTIHLWDAKTGSENGSFSATARILALAFAPDDKTLAVGTVGRDIQLLDTATGTVQHTLRTRGPYFFRLQFSPDGRKLAAANGTAGGFRRDHRVWSLDDGGGSLDLNTGAEAASFSFSADSRRLVIGDTAGMIQIWDLDRRAEVERFSAHRKVGMVQLLPDDRILFAGAEGISLWQARRPGVVSLTGYQDALRQVAFSPDSRWLLAAGLATNVPVWDAQDGRLTGTYTRHSRGRPIAMGVSGDGRVASADADQMVRMWNPVSFETQWETSLAPAAQPYWLAFSPDGRRIYAPSKADTLTVLDAATGKRLNSISGLENVLDGIAVSPDGQLIALCQKVKLSVRRADDLQEVWSVAALPQRCATFSPDGKWIATGEQDGAVRLWEVASGGRVQRSLRSHAGSVSGVSFHPDGSRLVSCSGDGQVKVWDWRAGVELLTLPTPGGGQLWHALFSPDGKTIAAAGGDGTVTLWKTE